MLAQIAPLIVRGVIDNTVRGCTELHLWGIDNGEPLEFLLPGDCLPDIAGCKVEFTNTSPLPCMDKEHPVLKGLRQGGHTTIPGDMTLSRRIPEHDNRQALCNILSLEFFLMPETRVLIEMQAFSFDISLPQWTPSWEDANAQAFLNMDTLRAHVEWSIKHFRGPGLSDIQRSEFPACDWDYRLNRAEAAMAILPTIQEKYAFEESGYLSIAYVMGRMDILEQKAAEDEAQMPPDPEEMLRTWEVVDLVDPAYRNEVKRALHHPLFLDTSHLTAMVQQTLSRSMDKQQRPSPAMDQFISAYAALVSHILATILLIRQKDFSISLAQSRLNIITSRVHDLAEAPLLAAHHSSAELRQATESVLSRLADIAAHLRQR